MLRCIGGPMDGQYVEPAAAAGDVLVATPGGQPLWLSEDEIHLRGAQTGTRVRHYHPSTLAWGFNGMNFQRDVLLWDGLDTGDAFIVLMRKFVGLLDEQRL
jgi:hypothetical protein